MPRGLIRFHQSRQTHFVTFSCYHHRELLITDESRELVESALERVRRSYRLYIYGYVVMPDHVHLLLSEPQTQDNPNSGTLKPGFGLSGSTGWLNNPQEYPLADALKSLKQGVARRLIENAGHFWQKRYHDFNVRNRPQFVQKLRYIHDNPVKAGLCKRPEDWPWSSFLHYATGVEGRVEIESEWTARKRERAAGRLCPAVVLTTQAKTGLEWAT